MTQKTIKDFVKIMYMLVKDKKSEETNKFGDSFLYSNTKHRIAYV